MTREAGAPDPRRGILGRATGVVYWYLLVEACFLLAAAPAFIGMLLLERDASNVPLYALCLIPVGPAFSAAMSTIAARSDELTVWPQFWKAYARNVVDVLWVWVPALALAAVLGITVAYGATAGVDGFFVVAAVVFLVILALWAANALVIASFFSFRARDIARLALYYLAARPLVTLGAFSYLLIAAAIVTFTSDWVLALLGVFFAAFAVVNAKSMTTDIRARFVAPEA
ncbi:glycosyltransferase [Microbacterium ureisolvens]|uniref:glycosyltransferase n=1 Tax=Microbacterium ureisolvens TaxID=2781186 RepID=UPI00363EA858